MRHPGQIPAAEGERLRPFTASLAFFASLIDCVPELCTRLSCFRRVRSASPCSVRPFPDPCVSHWRCPWGGGGQSCHPPPPLPRKSTADSLTQRQRHASFMFILCAVCSVLLPCNKYLIRCASHLPRFPVFVASISASHRAEAW